MPTDDGCLLRVTATSFARDVFCAADVVHPAATVDDGMMTLRAGQSVAIRVRSPAGAPPAFGAALRCANDLLPAADPTKPDGSVGPSRP